MAAFVGAFLAGPVSDNFGRKKTMLMSITGVSIASIPISFLPNWQLLLGIFFHYALIYPHMICDILLI